MQMKEMKTAKASSDCPTLLHYVARILLRNDPSNVTFIEDMPHLEAAARGLSSPEFSYHNAETVTSVCTNSRDFRSSVVLGPDSGARRDQAIAAYAITSPRSVHLGYAGKTGCQFNFHLTKLCGKPFVEQVGGSVDALAKMANSLETELTSMLAFFGENPDSPDSPKPEDFFGMILTFSSSLQVCLHLF